MQLSYTHFPYNNDAKERASSIGGSFLVINYGVVGRKARANAKRDVDKDECRAPFVRREQMQSAMSLKTNIAYIPGLLSCINSEASSFAVKSPLKNATISRAKSVAEPGPLPVIVSAEIKHDGSIGDQKVKQSVNDELDREAQRIISYMPKWEPATEEGTKMKSIVDIPIKFQISDFEK